MKKTLLVFFCSLASCAFPQSIQITEVVITPDIGGINLKLKTTSNNGAGFLTYDYTVSENIILFNACYWFNATLPVLNFENDFNIPLVEGQDYDLHLFVFNSSNPENCDYYSLGDTYSTQVLSAGRNPVPVSSLVYPNPTQGVVYFSTSVWGAEIFDISGRLVKSLPKGTAAVNLADFPGGLYLLKIDTEKGSAMQKVILRK